MPDTGFPGEELLVDMWRRYREGDIQAIEEAYQQVLPFGLRLAAKICGKNIEPGSEEAGIIRKAFLEVFERYEPELGSLYSNLGRVMKQQLFEQFQVQEKQRGGLFSAFWARGQGLRELGAYDIRQVAEDVARRNDISKLSAILQDFGITYYDLVKVSPGDWKVRERVKEIAYDLAGNRELMEYLLNSTSLPPELPTNQGVLKGKDLEKYADYIIAVALINHLGLKHLMPCILPRKRRGWYGGGKGDRGREP